MTGQEPWCQHQKTYTCDCRACRREMERQYPRRNKPVRSRPRIPGYVTTMGLVCLLSLCPAALDVYSWAPPGSLLRALAVGIWVLSLCASISLTTAVALPKVLDKAHEWFHAAKESIMGFRFFGFRPSKRYARGVFDTVAVISGGEIALHAHNPWGYPVLLIGIMGMLRNFLR